MAPFHGHCAGDARIAESKDLSGSESDGERGERHRRGKGEKGEGWAHGVPMLIISEWVGVTILANVVMDLPDVPPGCQIGHVLRGRNRKERTGVPPDHES